MRFVVGIVVGLIASLVAAVIVGVVAFLTTFSLPPGTNAGDMRQVVVILTNLPLATQLGLSVAWLASAFCGVAVARMIARQAWAGWAVAVIVAIYFGLNAFILPLPLWIKALWVIAPLLGGWIGNRLGGGTQVAAAATEAEVSPAIQ